MDERISRGMRAQLALRQRRLDSGEKSVGWKIAFGAPEAMKRLGIEAPLIGFLTEGALLLSGAVLDLADYTRPVVEPEIAIHMGASLKGGASRDEAVAAIAGLGPAFEIADVTFPPDDVEAILADNIYQRHIILGAADMSRAGAVIDGLSARIRRAGRQIAETNAVEANTGNLVDLVRHTADTLALFGETLRAGEIIIAGSVVPPIWIEDSGEIKFTLDPLASKPGGSLSVEFVKG